MNVIVIVVVVVDSLRVFFLVFSSLGKRLRSGRDRPFDAEDRVRQVGAGQRRSGGGGSTDVSRREAGRVREGRRDLRGLW